MQWKSSLVLSALAVGLALPAVATAQAEPKAPAQQPKQHAMGQHRGMGGMGGPAGMLLSYRTDLKLTDDQVQKLETIRSTYQQKNRPLMEQLRPMRGDSQSRADLRQMTPEQRQQALEQMRARAQTPEVKKALQELRANRQAAAKEARAVLTADQQKWVDQRLEQRRTEWKARGDSAGGHRGGHHGGEKQDSGSGR
jgi:Spy/CpxP family protein refolding chaperone